METGEVVISRGSPWSWDLKRVRARLPVSVLRLVPEPLAAACWPGCSAEPEERKLASFSPVRAFSGTGPAPRRGAGGAGALGTYAVSAPCRAVCLRPRGLRGLRCAEGPGGLPAGKAPRPWAHRGRGDTGEDPVGGRRGTEASRGARSGEPCGVRVSHADCSGWCRRSLVPHPRTRSLSPPPPHLRFPTCPMVTGSPALPTIRVVSGTPRVDSGTA